MSDTPLLAATIDQPTITTEQIIEACKVLGVDARAWTSIEIRGDEVLLHLGIPVNTVVNDSAEVPA